MISPIILEVHIFGLLAHSSWKKGSNREFRFQEKVKRKRVVDKSKLRQHAQTCARVMGRVASRLKARGPTYPRGMRAIMEAASSHDLYCEHTYLDYNWTMPRCPSCHEPVDDLQKHRKWCTKKDAHLAQLSAGFSDRNPAPVPRIQLVDPVIESAEPVVDEVRAHP